MYSVLFADDESSIRHGIQRLIDWKGLGFDTYYEADNGQKALDTILEFRPDLVLLDIRMPLLHGTDVIKAAREAGFTGRCIILSGYSDFTYAQTAIKYHVDFYITKPIDDDELLEAVTHIKQILDEETHSNNFNDVFRTKAHDAIISEIISGTVNPNRFSADELKELGLTASIYQVVIYENYRQLVTVKTYDFPELLNVPKHAMDIIEHIIIDGNDVVLLKGGVAINLFSNFLEKYDNYVPEKGSPLDSFFICYGSPVTDVSRIYSSYQDAFFLLNRRFFCAQDQHTIGYSNMPGVNDLKEVLDNSLIDYYTRVITDNLQTFNRKKVAEILYNLEKYLSNVDSPIDSVKLFCTDLYLQIKEKISRAYSSQGIPFPSNSTIIENIDKKYYLYEIILFFSEQFEMIMNATGNPSANNILDDVISYIDHNYQNNIKLETIAPLFGYNSAYLGKIFTKAVNESFNSYVDHIRIKHSKKLLRDGDLKVYEIAERIGYSNVDYFHKKFKKYVGMSPAEYRRSLFWPGQQPNASGQYSEDDDD